MRVVEFVFTKKFDIFHLDSSWMTTFSMILDVLAGFLGLGQVGSEVDGISALSGA